MFYERHTELVDQINTSFLHCRFSKERFEKKVRDIIKHYTDIEEDKDILVGWDVDQTGVDYLVTVGIEKSGSDWYGYIDFYYLMMREEGCLEMGTDDRIFITEIDYDFD